MVARRGEKVAVGGVRVVVFAEQFRAELRAVQCQLPALLVDLVNADLISLYLSCEIL